jgi:two-component system phosphate regulon response regulator PhoB
LNSIELTADNTHRAFNVLVADDDSAMRELICVHLTNAGYKVTVAEDAVVAGKMLFSSTPDLLIVDMKMPYMSGLEFAATMLSDPTAPRVPVILITANERTIEQAAIQGIDCLRTPFFANELLQAVERALHTPVAG